MREKNLGTEALPMIWVDANFIEMTKRVEWILKRMRPGAFQLHLAASSRE